MQQQETLPVDHHSDDGDEDDVVNFIIVEEHEDGTITWDSSYEDLDEFFEVLNVVAEEAAKPKFMMFRVH